MDGDPAVECPRCHRRTGVRVLIGSPTEEAEELAMQGKLYLGGCLSGPSDPDRHCSQCQYEWREDASDS